MIGCIIFHTEHCVLTCGDDGMWQRTNLAKNIFEDDLVGDVSPISVRMSFHPEESL